MGRLRFGVLLLCAALACGVGAYYALRRGAPAAPVVSIPAARLPGSPAPAVYACARCHALPPPEMLPRDRWPAMIDKMTEIIAAYRIGQALTTEELATIGAYYRDGAPEALPELPADAGPSPLAFTGSLLGLPPTGREDGRPPVITNVRIVRLDSTGGLGCWCAMRSQGR